MWTIYTPPLSTIPMVEGCAPAEVSLRASRCDNRKASAAVKCTNLSVTQVVLVKVGTLDDFTLGWR